MNVRLLALLVVMSPKVHAGPDQVAADLVKRVWPAQAARFQFETCPPADGADVFEIESRDGRIVLRGSSGLSLASAFNRYLEAVAGGEVSPCGSQLHLPSSLPAVPEKIRARAPVPVRFMNNYCVFGYTSPWWDWPRWERELDWMALHGINLPFILTGQEAVWIRTFTKYGYSEQEIRRWLGSPAHFPWTFMQNMENFGGELPASWVPQRIDLARKIIGRAREFGMNVTLQGYYGMVPPGFAQRHPGCKVLPQGGWAGGLKRPDMLDPTDPLFAKIAATFLAEQEALYGRAGFYMADPFHEGGNAQGVDMTECGRRVFQSMTAADPRAVWVKMCWQTDNAKLLAGIPPERVLALDLWAENRPFWPNGAFQGKSWVWGLLHGFGGNSELNGDLRRIATGFPEALASPQRGRLAGWGFVPEGHCNSPAVYSLMSEFSWRSTPVDLQEWIPGYLHRRYGADSVSARRAWEALLDSVYGVRYGFETPANSLLQARPLRGNKARTWGGTQIPYAAGTLVAAWNSLIEAAPECAASDGYRYDLADVTRQVLGDLGTSWILRLQQAVEKQDKETFGRLAPQILGLCDDLDTLLATRPEFLLGRWIEDARKWGTTPEEKDLYEWQARTLLTTWDDNPGSALNDYANRQWSGLVKDYYRMRWSRYIEASRPGSAFDQAKFLADLGPAEKAWTRDHQTYPSQPAGDTVALTRSLRAKYAALIQEAHPQPITPTAADVVGCWEYHAEGTTYLREFRADGTIQSYGKSGQKLPWFDGFHWKIEGSKIVASRGTQIVTHQMFDKDTMEFASEGFGKARRVPTP